MTAFGKLTLKPRNCGIVSVELLVDDCLGLGDALDDLLKKAK